MPSHYLENLFNPSSIAVVGASEKINSIGMTVFKNIIEGKFPGRLYPINLNHSTVQGFKAFKNLSEIDESIDLVIIATPAPTTLEILKQCGEKNIHLVLILSAGFNEAGSDGTRLEETALEIAKRNHIRLLGPNCIGFLLPYKNLNATFTNGITLPGQISLISQSGALCVSILDWARQQKIGFSAVFSLGNAIDIDFGDILDYLALDPKTKSILLYIESIHKVRSFLSNLRAAARLKPIIVIKAGRFQQSSKAAISHTGAIIGKDDVFDAALKRTGAIRVYTIQQLFSAAEILSRDFKFQGDTLTIITNGGGAGVMAADQAVLSKVQLSSFNESTILELNKVLPSYWSHENPIDILGDATPERFQNVLNICLKDPNIHAFLIILVPLVMTKPEEIAKAIAEISKKSTKPILCCWLGEFRESISKNILVQNNIPIFETPEEAILAFSYLTQYHHNQKLLTQVPESFSFQPEPDVKGADLIIRSVIAERRKILTLLESKAILNAFKIPTTQTLVAHTVNEAIVVAETIGFPVVMKILSPEITHKQDVQGVQLNVSSGENVRHYFKKMTESAKLLFPNAEIIGVTIEPMIKNQNDRELMIGVLRDPIFGPVISFGPGGSIVEVMQDRAIGLPPLNLFLAQDLINQTKVAKLLKKFRNMPPVNLLEIENILLRVSEMVSELPWIREMDINPLIANDKMVVAVDARIVVDYEPPSLSPYHHMAIYPYPKQLIKAWEAPDGTSICIRPIRPEDAEIEKEFVRNLSQQSKYFRFMENLNELTPELLNRFTQIDYDREMALIATIRENETERNIGVARYIINPDLNSCEFGLVVADAWQKKGLGTELMTELMITARMKGLKTMEGEILNNNYNMLNLVQKLGFSIKNSENDPTIKLVIKDLQDEQIRR